MKANKLILTIVASIFTIVAIFTGCKKDGDETPSSTSIVKQKLTLHVHNVVGSNPAAYGTQYLDASGRRFNISDMRYYLSNIVLINSDGSEYPISGKNLLINPSQQNYDLADVPVGSYKGFKFIVGLDSATNHLDPTTYAAGNPLAIQTPGIHWDWNSGYIFMKIEGQVDTTLTNTGIIDYDYFYHIGMDDYNRTIDFSTESFTVVSGSDKQIGIQFNLLNALNNVDLRTENVTHTMDNVMLADKIVNNWASAFTIL